VRTFLNYLIETGVLKSNAGVRAGAEGRRAARDARRDQVASLLAISGDSR
jgi:site-specific recombinase XerC